MANIFPIDFEEKLTMAQDDYILFSDSEDGNKIKKAQYKNLKGEKGDTGAKINSASFSGDDIVFGETDGSSVTLANAKTTLQGPQGEEGPTGPTGNGIASITSSKVGKTTTVTITETNTNVDTFQIEDGADGESPNVKLFTLSSTSDLTNAQAAYDRFIAGKDAIIKYDNKIYFYSYSTATNAYWFVPNEKVMDQSSYSTWAKDTIQLAISSGTVTAIASLSVSTNDSGFIRVGKNYGTPYTPTNNGSPATKKYVDDKVAELMGLGKFLSLWDSSTGQPISFPLSTPYTYTTGDYFLVETVSSATPPVNYKPNGSSYTGAASSTTESDEVEVGDIYIYDGTTWLLAINHGKTVSFANLAGSPSDNTALSNALAAKQDALTLPATPTQGHLVTWGADNETLVDGGAVPTGDVTISSQSGNILTSGMKIWAGSQSDYENLGSRDTNTVYLTI